MLTARYSILILFAGSVYAYSADSTLQHIDLVCWVCLCLHAVSDSTWWPELLLCVRASEAYVSLFVCVCLQCKSQQPIVNLQCK